MVRTVAIASAILMSMAVFSAHAATISFSFGIGGSNANVPTFTLQNTSTSNAVLTAFDLSIGDLSRNFDSSVIVTNGTSATATLNSPDAVNNGARADNINYSFGGGGFLSGEIFVFNGDIDSDPNNNVVLNFNSVFGNNGTAPNAVATATFLFEGETFILSDIFADNTGAQTLSDSVSVSAIPVPAALPLMVTALVGLGFASRRRKQTASV